MVTNINFEGTEHSALFKVMLMMAAGLKHSLCMIIPYHILELPEKRGKNSGHLCISDLVIKSSESQSSSAESNSSEAISVNTQPAESSVTTVCQNDVVVMVIECKKSYMHH